jgi:predicted transcriptional regulator of viral defense system
MTQNNSEFLEIFRENNGILKATDAIEKGIPEYRLYKMYKIGLLVKEARGLYRLNDLEPFGNSDLIQVSMLIPKAVIALISALAFHGITTQIPHRVYVMLPRGVKKPHISASRQLYPLIHKVWIYPPYAWK